MVLLMDVLLVSVNLFIAFFIYYGYSLDFDLKLPFLIVPKTIIVSLVVFLITGSYKGIIRRTGFTDSIIIFLSTVVIFVFQNIFLNFSKFNHWFYQYPIPITVLHFMLNFNVLIVTRLMVKYLYLNLVNKHNIVKRNVVIYGAGDKGTIVYNTFLKNPAEDVRVIAFIDDDINKIGKKINRIPIYEIDKIDEKFIKENGISEIVIAIQDLSGAKIQEITDKFLNQKVKVKIVPPISKWVDGSLKNNQIQDIKIEDLLNRNEIQIDNEEIDKEFYGKVIMVTGAAGSIGSEIVTQLAEYKCEKIVLIDFAESALYEVQQDLLRQNKLNIKPIVADVRDFDKMQSIFRHYKPSVVFHAAAYKHVPLMEENPYEAVKINVIGTKNIADLSCEFNVSKFVMVSTDKAVNPTNVMGATKRVAEIYTSCLNKSQCQTKFITTRFGNVLGSNGSVIPLFKKQIASGGPITLTHKEITRYFMTIPEACQLVIEAGYMGDGGEIYVFDMGESVKIFDLAKKMIKLSGFNYPKDIDIKITGLRPGEKLYEELLNDDETTLPTHHKKIKIHQSMEIDIDSKITMIEELIKLNKTDKNLTIVKKIKEIVPEFLSNNSIFEELDIKDK